MQEFPSMSKGFWKDLTIKFWNLKVEYFKKIITPTTEELEKHNKYLKENLKKNFFNWIFDYINFRNQLFFQKTVIFGETEKILRGPRQ